MLKSEMRKTEVTMSIPNPKVIAGAILIALMLLSLGLMPPAFAESTETTFHNVTVDAAYNMITNCSFLDLVILDVRYQCEYDRGHLYDAVLIPYNELETRVGELEEYKNHEIIVYCRSGYRSEIACEILVEYNFTKVHNMLGGILDWVKADYPIWTTSHYVTVNVVDEEILLQIEPLLLRQTGCIPCAQNQTCPSGNEPTDIQFTVLGQEENHTVILLTYEVNGTTFEVTIARTLLWSYNELTDKINRTSSLMSTEITAEDTSMEFYSLSYLVQHVEYNLTLYTTLTPVNSEAYNSSFTIMNYVPAGKSEVTSFEFIEFNSSVTLSQQYVILGKVAKEIGKVYEKSGNETLVQLAQSYYTMEKEAKHLSKLVEKQLQEYDLQILQGSAVLMDEPLGPPLLNGGGGGGGSPPPSTCTFECWVGIFVACYPYQLLESLKWCMFLCIPGALLCLWLYPLCLKACFLACGVTSPIESAIVCAISAWYACCL